MFNMIHTVRSKKSVLWKTCFWPCFMLNWLYTVPVKKKLTGNQQFTAALWPTSQWKTTVNCISFSLLLPTVRSESKHLIVHKNVKHDTNQWQKHHQKFEATFLALSHARLTIYITSDKQGWQKNDNLPQQFSLLHNENPLAKHLSYRCLSL